MSVTDRIVIAVSDKGSGIPPEHLNRIFQPFYRAEENSINKGFGLGLSLTDRIIKLHKGSIDVFSVVGEGTRFVIYLPISKVTSIA